MNLTAIIERYQNRFVDKYTLSHDQKHALYGTIELHCSHCEHHQSQHLSCEHRSCENHLTTVWLERQSQKLLPVEYFMVTFTIPFELRALARKNQKSFYTLLFNCAVSTLITFGVNDKKLGSELAMTVVLRTQLSSASAHYRTGWLPE